MKRLNMIRKTFILAAGLLALTAASSQAAEVTGAGATFPAPVYSKWAEVYKAETGNALNYQAIGSGGGIKQIRAKTVDFGASDDPVKAGDLKKWSMVQFPAVIGGIVPVVNLPGINPGQLVLSGALLGDIFRGAVTKWNDAAIARLNAGIKLPDTAITLVYRSDSSGTTAGFTHYLAEVSPQFKSDIGAGKTVNWKTGVGGKGNAGVAANVAKIAGSIGYVEYAYAKQNKLAHAALINRDGKAVQPDETSFAAAATKADWKSKPGFGISLNNQPGEKAWPITSASFILFHGVAEKPANTLEALKFFDWALRKGQKLASELDYVPMPANVVDMIQASWKSDIKDKAGAAIWK
jgi:phosphate transport system substrate-binding protein